MSQQNGSPSKELATRLIREKLEKKIDQKIDRHEINSQLKKAKLPPLSRSVIANAAWMMRKEIAGEPAYKNPKHRKTLHSAKLQENTVAAEQIIRDMLAANPDGKVSAIDVNRALKKAGMPPKSQSSLYNLAYRMRRGVVTPAASRAVAISQAAQLLVRGPVEETATRAAQPIARKVLSVSDALATLREAMKAEGYVEVRVPLAGEISAKKIVEEVIF